MLSKTNIQKLMCTKKEKKNLNTKISNLVLRDFDNKQYEEEILATDVDIYHVHMIACKIMFIYL